MTIALSYWDQLVYDSVSFGMFSINPKFIVSSSYTIPQSNLLYFHPALSADLTV